MRLLLDQSNMEEIHAERNRSNMMEFRIVSDEDDQKEEKTITTACEYIRNFIDTVVEAGYDELSEAAKTQINDVKNKFLALGHPNVEPEVPIDDTKGNIPKEHKAGAIPKVRLDKNKTVTPVIGIEKKSSKKNYQSESSNEKTEHESDNSDSDHVKLVKKIKGKKKRKQQKKKSIKKEKKSSNSENSEDSFSNSASDESITSESESEPVRPSRRKKKKSDILERLLERIDNRRVPDIEKYDYNTGEFVSEYLTRFEKYCKENIKGDSIFWVAELEKHLTGKTLKAFLSLKDRKDTYKSLKKKMIKWDEETKEQRKRNARQKFFDMRYRDGEDLFLYSNRLEKQFRLAFPKHTAEKSSTLREKYCETVPESFRNTLDTHLLNIEASGRSVRWSAIQKVARLKDVRLQRKKTKDTASESDRNEIIINIQQENDKRANKASYGYSQNNQNHNEFPRNGSQYPRSNNNNNYFGNHKKETYQTNQPSRYFQQKETQNFGKFNAQNAPQIQSCAYCKKIGHTIDVCRRRLKQCFRCFKPGHHAKDCDHTERNQSRRSQSEAPRSRRPYFQGENQEKNGEPKPVSNMPNNRNWLN